MCIVRPLLGVIFAQKWLHIINVCRKRPSQVLKWDPKVRPEDSWRLLWGYCWRPLEDLGSSWEPLWVCTEVHEDPRGALELDFLCFFRFCQAKVQFSNKSTNFTCITAMLGVCYAGKNAIFKNKHDFYLHDGHLRPMLGSCYAGKSEGCHNKASLLPAYQTPDMALMQVKMMFLFQ